MRILVADDEPTARLMMRATLEQAGFEVGVADDGQDALRQFTDADQAYDMVMLDVDMPRLDGYQACIQLRQEVGDGLPIVMVTGMDDLASIDRVFEAGATDYIAKPINWPLIGHRVRYLFRSSRALGELHAANARNSAVLSAIPDTLCRLDTDGVVLDLKLAKGTKPYRHLPRTGQSLGQALPPEIAARLMAAAAKARDTAMPVGLEIEMPGYGGQPRYLEMRLVRIDARETLCLIRNISARKESENRVYRLAYFDPLTGLPNRLSFVDRLNREIQRTHHEGGKLAILHLDLDGFKDVNDTLGHGAGDLLLQGVAERLRTGVRPSDVVAHDRAEGDEADDQDLARLGGDEFTVLIPYLRHADDVPGMAGRIHELMRRPFALDGWELALTASIGIAVYPDDGQDAASLLKHADTAMYHAKGQGRNNFQFYNSSLTQTAMRRLELESGLRMALERNEFFLVYQPKLDLASGRIRSMEALIRWQHPEKGLVSPLAFIPAAEANGLIVPIGDWVLRTACADAARWQDAGHSLRVAVNLSAVQFKNANIVSRIKEILQDSGLAAERLELEVTEGALMEDSQTTLQTLNALRQTGMQLSLDDFGTGYSSLSYLQRLPLNSVKVDQSFVRRLPADTGSLAIVQAIVALAKNLGFSVTAEGVETLEQALILQGLDCETLQGYYISKPVPAGEIDALLTQRWFIREASAALEPVTVTTN